ncbi:hypothetical protein PN462_15655 [Spirulina sp. CS-785/01]|uniref:hypothetical protein n=1 Tax=Spirulina sp. CS-785/01 TaxID=3021716 RepID=UPI0023315A57|nr:hypothetical protein [Spirulina sp. CS-785/01]MDB9314546.1 hypothetical protein [Spirulina sp. CS-785/01]
MMNDILKQAHQGSTAAIIQVMNEGLADIGVRTRAVLEKGILKVLCEAQEEKSLEREILVPRLRDILEGIEPRNLRRVQISSRLAQEQQLVWIGAGAQTSDYPFLWSEEIKLRKPNFFQKIGKPRPWETEEKEKSLSVSFPTASSTPFLSRSHIRVLFLCLLSFVAGVFAYNFWLLPFSNSLVSNQNAASPSASPSNTSSSNSPSPTASPVASPSTSPDTSPPPQTVLLPASSDNSSLPSPPASLSPTEDPFAQAVRLAEQMALKGQTAQTRTEWLDVASKWQEASELMALVPPDHPSYDKAQERVEVYQRNSEVAQRKAAAQ